MIVKGMSHPAIDSGITTLALCWLYQNGRKIKQNLSATNTNMSRLRADSKKLVINPMTGHRPVKTNLSSTAFAIEDGKNMIMFATLTMIICRAR